MRTTTRITSGLLISFPKRLPVNAAVNPRIENMSAIPSVYAMARAKL